MHEREVVHRDLKPENIMVCTDGSLRIMDFGIAKAAAMRRLTFVGLSPRMGTPDYTPEQVKGKRGDLRGPTSTASGQSVRNGVGAPPFEGAIVSDYERSPILATQWRRGSRTRMFRRKSKKSSSAPWSVSRKIATRRLPR